MTKLEQMSEIHDKWILYVGRAILEYYKFIKRKPNEEYMPPSKEDIINAYRYDNIFNQVVQSVVAVLMQDLDKIIGEAQREITKVLGYKPITINDIDDALKEEIGKIPVGESIDILEQAKKEERDEKTNT